MPDVWYNFVARLNSLGLPSDNCWVRNIVDRLASDVGQGFSPILLIRDFPSGARSISLWAPDNDRPTITPLLIVG